jgi:hypothetical protein
MAAAAAVAAKPTHHTTSPSGCAAVTARWPSANPAAMSALCFDCDPLCGVEVGGFSHASKTKSYVSVAGVGRHTSGNPARIRDGALADRGERFRGGARAERTGLPTATAPPIRPRCTVSAPPAPVVGGTWPSRANPTGPRTTASDVPSRRMHMTLDTVGHLLHCPTVK